MDLMQRRRVMLAAGKRSRLPREYQEVEWLESTGTQYILTLLTINDGDCVKATFTPLNVTDTQRFFGAGSGAPESGIMFGSNGRTFMGAINNAWKYNFPPITQARTTVEYRTNNNWYINGTYISSTENRATGNNVRVALFAVNYYGSIYTPSVMRFEEFVQFSYAGETRQHLVPCYRKSDSKPGMYDIISGTFYTNVRAGEFLVGPDVN